MVGMSYSECEIATLIVSKLMQVRNFQCRKQATIMTQHESLLHL